MSHNLPDLPVDRESLLAFLETCQFNVATTDHAPLFTVADSQKLRGEIEGAHTKNLFLKDRKGNYFLLTAHENSEINLKTLHKLLGGSGKFSFGNAEMMQELLGVAPGAVTALAVINDRSGRVQFAMDQSLLEYDLINCHPMTNEATTTLKKEDLLDYARICDHEPKVVNLSEGD